MENKLNIFDLADMWDNPPFTIKVGGTTYEVSTHFDPEGRQSVLEQFKKLLLEMDRSSAA